MGTRVEEIQQGIAEGFALEERALQEDAKRCKDRLDEQLLEQTTAKKGYPGLLKKLEAQKKLMEQVSSEIQALEVEIAVAEQSLYDDGKSALSRIARSRTDYERAQSIADNYVAEKIKNLTTR